MGEEVVASIEVRVGTATVILEAEETVSKNMMGAVVAEHYSFDLKHLDDAVARVKAAAEADLA